MKNILMVCVGNICRSPIAEGLLKDYAQKRDLPLQVSSAGLAAMLGRPADPNSIAIMQQRGIDIGRHQPRQLTFEMLQSANLVLVMEEWHQREIAEQFPSMYGKVHRIGKWGDFEIPDPYKLPKDAFIESCYLIEQGLHDWQKKLWDSNV